MATRTEREGVEAGSSRGGSSSPFLRVALPWPKRELWPNGRPKHWGARLRLSSHYRETARLLTLLELRGRRVDGLAEREIDVELEIAPPVATKNGRRNVAVPDVDNVVAAVKHGLDGIAEALRVNDRAFRLATPRFVDRCPQGEVRVLLSIGGSA